MHPRDRALSCRSSVSLPHYLRGFFFVSLTTGTLYCDEGDRFHVFSRQLNTCLLLYRPTPPTRRSQLDSCGVSVAGFLVFARTSGF